MAEGSHPIVLIIDHNPVDANAAERALGDDHFIYKASNAEQARQLARDLRPDCILLDEHVSSVGAVPLVREFVELGAAVVLLTGADAGHFSGRDDFDKRMRAALDAGAMDFVPKWNLNSAVLRRAVDMAVTRYSIFEERQALAVNGARFLKVLDQSDEFVGLADLRGYMSHVNAGGLRLVGWPAGSRAVGERITAFHPEQDADRLVLDIIPHVRQHGIWTGELNLKDAEGTPIPTEACIMMGRNDANRPDFLAIIARDVRERNQLSLQLQQAQKLEAVGRLAGGVAHDFNNLLTAIFSFSSFALREIGEDSPAREDIQEILVAAERARELTGQLLAYSRQRSVSPEEVDVEHSLRALEKMLRRLVGEDVDVRVEVDDRAGAFLIDPGALDQVIINLAVNARDAMPTGGRLEIKAFPVDLREDYRPNSANDIPPGDYSAIEVSDNGTGIDPSVQETLFEPFVTTKSTIRGTGLGLSTCHGIVKQAGGWLWATTEPGGGSVFHIYFPRLASKRDRVHSAEELPAHGGEETILLVEDSEQVRRLTARILRSYGYQVLEARDGEEALRKSRETSGEIALLVTDVVLPGIAGRELAKRFAQQRPHMKVLFMSGYSLKAVQDRGISPKGVPLIEKPFSPDALARRVRALMDSSGGGVGELMSQRPRLLLVEDDQRFSGAVSRVLNREYELDVVGDGADALEWIGMKGPFDAVLCDYSMPSMTGEELYEAVCAIHPELAERFVFLTGAEDDVLQRLRLATRCPVLKKPAEVARMRSTLSEVMMR